MIIIILTASTENRVKGGQWCSLLRFVAYDVTVFSTFSCNESHAKLHQLIQPSRKTIDDNTDIQIHRPSIYTRLDDNIKMDLQDVRWGGDHGLDRCGLL